MKTNRTVRDGGRLREMKSVLGGQPCQLLIVGVIREWNHGEKNIGIGTVDNARTAMGQTTQKNLGKRKAKFPVMLFISTVRKDSRRLWINT